MSILTHLQKVSNGFCTFSHTFHILTDSPQSELSINGKQRSGLPPTLILLNVLSSLVDDRTHMIIRQGIKNLLSLSPALHQLVRLQNPELMRNSRLRHMKRLRQIAHTHLRLKKDKKNV